jgi:uncharacterized protein (TIGR02145 family)
VGDYLKSTSGWNDGGNGSNASGFTGLPGGFRSNNGFVNDGVFGDWWSSSAAISSLWRRELHSYGDDVNRVIYSQGHGFSARCIKD